MNEVKGDGGNMLSIIVKAKLDQNDKINVKLQDRKLGWKQSSNVFGQFARLNILVEYIVNNKVLFNKIILPQIDILLIRNNLEINRMNFVNVMR